MLPNKELAKIDLEEFFKSIDEVIKPYFDKFGYKRNILKKRSRVIFEKVISEKLVIVDYFSYAGYGIKGFLVNFSSENRYLYTIKQNESSKADEPWKYENEIELKKLLSESIKIIDEQQLLQIEENQSIRSGV